MHFPLRWRKTYRHILIRLLSGRCKEFLLSRGPTSPSPPTVHTWSIRKQDFYLEKLIECCLHCTWHLTNHLMMLCQHRILINKYSSYNANCLWFKIVGYIEWRIQWLISILYLSNSENFEMKFRLKMEQSKYS